MITHPQMISPIVKMVRFGAKKGPKMPQIKTISDTITTRLWPYLDTR